MQVGGIYEQRDAQSVTYILEDTSLFFPTGYKVLKSQEGKGFVRCNHLTHNGKDKLVYDISKYRTVISLATTIDSVAFLSVFTNLLDSLINAKNNGFMQYDNIDLSYENIYVDCNNYKVYLIYIPVNVGMVNNDVAYFIERFRYATNSFLENYFESPDDNILYINSIITDSQYSLEEMKYMIQEKLNNISTINKGKFNGINNLNNKLNNINNLNSNYNDSSSMNNMRINNVQDSFNNLSNMSLGVGNIGDIGSGRYNNNPLKNSGGSVRETMDISDLLKQIKNNGYHDEISENTCYGEFEQLEKQRNNRLNLGGTPGSLSKANVLGRNNSSNRNSNNVEAWNDIHNTNAGESRRNSSNRVNDRYLGNVDRNQDRIYDRSQKRVHDRGYDRNQGRDQDRNSTKKSRNSSRGGNTFANGNNSRTINATIKLISDAESGEIELIIDKEEFLIGKNFNVVDGFIPYNEGISRIHCKIVYERGSYSIVDLGSLNGTYVNGARIPVKSQVPISIGDKIGIANIEFMVETV